jgi:hypothetical protein
VGPCPAWCERAEGHPWDESSIFAHDDYGRTHESHIGDVEVCWTEVPRSPDHRTPTIDLESIDIMSHASITAFWPASRVLAELDQANPGCWTGGDRERWPPAILERLWRELEAATNLDAQVALTVEVSSE